MDFKASHLEFPPSPQWAVFADFDETWFAHNRTPENISYLQRLEAFAIHLARERGVLFAWVSGCTLELILHKCERNGLGLIPHYIAASHGGELAVSRQDALEPDPVWLKRIEMESFSAEVGGIIAEFNREGAQLRPQVQISKNIRSFYLPLESGYMVPRLRDRAMSLGLNLSISPSNSLAGDPSDTFDVDFTPGNCSKAEVVDYLLGKHGISSARAFAYGDNVGDVGMLKQVGNGRLLGNANPAAKDLFNKHVHLPYAQGILADLEQNFR